MNEKTRKLYYENAYTKTFCARVLECTQRGNAYEVVLDRTAFYPEGGGQPWDTGVLNRVNVLEVHEKSGRINHTTDKPLPIGDFVTGGVNWARRFALMQQHTGEHIVSGIANRFFGVDNVGFHMSAKAVTVDWNGELSGAQLHLVEQLANEAVYRNIPVQIDYPSSQKLAGMSYRSKKELLGEVRIVTIPGYDVCACCGTHVSRTGEIGAVKILGSQRYKGGTRITLACGSQAMADYAEKQRSVAEISALLSAKPEETAKFVERMLCDNAELKREISELQSEKIDGIIRTVPEDHGKTLRLEKKLSPDNIRKLAIALSSRTGASAAVLAGSEAEGFRYAVADPAGDVRPLGKELNQRFGGRGGGPKELVQGSITGGLQELQQFFSEFNFRQI